MLGITLSLEQITAAPPEVRRWIEGEMAKVWNVLVRTEAEAEQSRGPAPCTKEEALRIFQAVKGDFLASQVFLEFGREQAGAEMTPGLHVCRLADLLHHCRLSAGEQLLGCLELINGVFRQVRQDPTATLFGFDHRGNCYVSAETHKAIQSVWAALLATQASRQVAEIADATVPPFAAMSPDGSAPPAMSRDANPAGPAQSAPA